MLHFNLIACAVVTLLASSSIFAQQCQTASDCGANMYCVDQIEGGGYGYMCSATPVYDNGHSCATNGDCYSNTCTNNVCTGVAQGGSCIGDRQDCLNEPAIQCSGVNGAYICTRTSKSATGDSCSVNDDCTTGNCASGTCQATAQGQQCNPNNPQCASGLKCTTMGSFNYCESDSSSTCTATTAPSQTFTSTVTSTKTVIGARSTSTVTLTKTATSTLSPVTQTKTTTVTSSPSTAPNGAACKVDCDCGASSYCRITSTNTSGVGACAAKKDRNTQCRFDSTCISNYCDHTVKSCKSRPAGY